MKKFICLVLLISCAIIVNAQNDRSGQLIVPQIYDNIEFGEEGLFVVEHGKKKDVIDTSGEVVIPVQYDKVFIGEKGKKGEKGKSYGGMIVVVNDSKDNESGFDVFNMGLYDKNGVMLAPVENRTIEVCNGIAAIRNSVLLPDGRTIEPFDDIYIENENFVKVSKDRKSGVINRKGDFIIPIGQCKDVHASRYNADLLEVSVDAPYPIISKWGLYNKNGDVVIPVGKYESISIETNCIIVKQNGKKGALNFEGNVIVPIGRYENIKGIDGNFIEITSNGKHGVIDKDGKNIIPLGKYDYYRVESENLALVRSNEREGVIDGNGKEVIPLGKYDSFKMKYGVLYTSRNGKYMIIDKNGNVIPIEYDMIEPIRYSSYGLALVEKDKKLGVIDKNGKEIIPPIYDYKEIQSVEGKIIRLKKDNNIMYYNIEGELLLGMEKLTECQMKYGDLAMISEEGYFLATAKDGKKGVVKLW